MASLRFLFGMIPGTAKLEAKSDQLRKDYIEFKKFQTSDDLKHFESLEKEVTSGEFSQKVKKIKALKYKGSNEYAQEKEYLKLMKSKPFLKYQKLSGAKPAEDSPEYQELKNLESSPEKKRVDELDKIIKSDEFQESKKYLSLSSKERYEHSEEFKKQQELDQLKKSEKIMWYQLIMKKYPFSEVEKWEIDFEDKFESGKLDSKIWMNRYFYGDKILNNGYVFPDDKHAFTDGKNIEFLDKKLRINTRRENAKCLVWNPTLGFFEKEFEFTSDMISSAKGYTTQYGIYEAKVKVADSGVTQAFSLMTDQILPHIDVFRLEKGKLFAGNFWEEGKVPAKSISSTSGAKFTKDFFIYSLEWQPGILIWKINGLVFKKQTTGVPEKGLYIVFNSSLKEKAKESGIPSSLEIDWVRVYKKKS